MSHECLSIQCFWTFIGDTLSESILLRLPLTRSTILLHDFNDSPDITWTHRLLHTALSKAKICILRQWRSATPPSQEDWMVAMVQMPSHERVINSQQDQEEVFQVCPFFPSPPLPSPLPPSFSPIPFSSILFLIAHVSPPSPFQPPPWARR